MSAFFVTIKVNENEPKMLVQHFSNVGPTCWTRLRQCVPRVGPTFEKGSDIVMTLLHTCDCVAFENFFDTQSWRSSKCLKLW